VLKTVAVTCSTLLLASCQDQSVVLVGSGIFSRDVVDLETQRVLVRDQGFEIQKTMSSDEANAGDGIFLSWTTSRGEEVEYRITPTRCAAWRRDGDCGGRLEREHWYLTEDPQFEQLEATIVDCLIDGGFSSIRN
jgi:hypothetical protein